MRKKKEYPSECPSWLDTYSDMVTLMLTFFVLLFAMSTMSSAKWQKLVKAFQQNAGTYAQASGNVSGGTGSIILPAAAGESSSGSGGNSAVSSGGQAVTKVKNFDDLYPYFKQYVEQHDLQSQVQLYRGDGYTFLSFNNSIFFDGDSANLRPESKTILDFLCGAFVGIPDQIGEIRFYGHTAKVTSTDTPERQAFDRDLSDDRAKNVLLYVQGKGIIGGDKLVSEGYGEYRPVVKDDGTEAARARNRRVEIYISEAGKTQDVLDQVYSAINSSKGSN